MAQGVTIDFNANLTRFTGAIDKATNDLSKFQRNSQRTANNLKKVFSGVGIALGGVGIASVVSFSKRAIEAADNIAKTADKVGLTTDALQELRFAAERSGVSSRTLDMAMQRFSRRVAEAASGTGELKKTIDQLGIPLRDANGNLRETEVILDDFADAVQSAGGAQEQLRLSFKAFDSEGAAFVNALKNGSQGLRELRNEAREAGIVLEEELIRNAEKINDKWDTLTASIATKVKRLTLTIAQSISNWDDFFSDDGANEFNRLLEKRISLEKRIADFSGASNNRSKRNLQNLKKQLASVVESMEKLQDANIKGMKAESFNAEIIEAKNNLSGLDQSLAKFATSITEKFNPSISVEREIARINDAFGAGLISPETKAKAIADQLSRLNNVSLGSVSKSVKDFSKDLSTMGRAMDLIDDQFEALENQEAKRMAGLLPVDGNEAMEELERFSRDITMNFNPADAVAEQLSKIEEAFSAGLISPEVYFSAVTFEMDKLAESTEKTATKMNEFAVQAARSIQKTFADFLFDPFDSGIKGMLDGFVDMIKRMAAEAASNQILSYFTGGASGGGLEGLIGSFFDGIGARALGGPVASGSPYLVGEKGPELFVPKSSGSIIPNGASSGRLNQTININVTGQVDSRTTQQIATSIGTVTSRAMARNT